MGRNCILFQINTKLRPAIELAKSFTCSRLLSKRIEQMGDLSKINLPLKNFFAPNGIPLKEGDVVSRPLYANTLETISKQGPSAFYTGQIAQDLIQDIQDQNGIMTINDLNSYQPKWRKLYTSFYKGLKIVTGA